MGRPRCLRQSGEEKKEKEEKKKQTYHGQRDQAIIEPQILDQERPRSQPQADSDECQAGKYAVGYYGRHGRRGDGKHDIGMWVVRSPAPRQIDQEESPNLVGSKPEGEK